MIPCDSEEGGGGGGCGCGFFFQAEDGIRDRLVTGVQTCALPIYKQGIGNRDIQQCKNISHHSRTKKYYHHNVIPTQVSKLIQNCSALLVSQEQENGDA